MPDLLSVAGVSRAFGGVYAVRDVTVDVAHGETHAVIGPNGAGKSTLFSLIGGHLRAHAGSVSYDGERIDRLAPHQRARHVARALCGRPRLLLLDEPASGLRAAERAALAELIEELHARGLSMMLVEHDVAFVTRLADRITVLDLGRVIAQDTPAAVRNDPRVIAAYLGEEAPQ